MSRKRKELSLFLADAPAKRQRTNQRTSGLSSRVVIEDLTKRDKRRKDPVGRRYTPGSIKPGPVVPLKPRLQGLCAGIPIPSTSTFNPDSFPAVPDDFHNVVFEDVFPPQRNRQVR